MQPARQLAAFLLGPGKLLLAWPTLAAARETAAHSVTAATSSAVRNKKFNKHLSQPLA